MKPITSQKILKQGNQYVSMLSGKKKNLAQRMGKNFKQAWGKKDTLSPKTQNPTS